MKRTPHTTKHRAAAWLVVLAYVFTLPGILPSAFAALAWLEGSHGVEFRVASAQETDIVLTHRALPGAASHDAIHRHCLLARVLASISSPEGEGRPDHVAHFVSGPERVLEKRTIATPEQQPADEVPAPVFSEVPPLSLPETVVRLERPTGTPPRPPAMLAGIRSTLLLI